MPWLFKAYNLVFYYPGYWVRRYVVERDFRSSYLSSKMRLVEVPTRAISFFGYYNISPFNSNGEMLWCETTEKRTRGGQYSSADIIHFDPRSGKREIVSKTEAWNWQQGCMLQWFGGSGREAVYNIYDNVEDEYHAEIADLRTGNRRRICKPIYSVARDGNFALTLNYDRITSMRPSYGYFRKMDLTLPADSEDGVWFVDIPSNSSRLIVTLEQLKRHQPDSTMEGARHKVIHIDIAPNGKRFMFLHRWIGPQGRYHRLYTANCADGGDLYLITGKELVSHNCWMPDSTRIVSFSRCNDGRDRYNLFEDRVGFVETIGEDDFVVDGHPSISPDGKWMLTDDYPDEALFSHLYLYDLSRKKKHEIGRFHQPFRYRGEGRIDLHPKWSPDGRFVSIDSGHHGKREFHVIDVSGVTKP